MTTSSPRILSFDIESAGVNALKADLGFVILFGYKWAHEKEAHVLTIDRQSLRRFDDKALLRAASKLFAEADLVVGHFASLFDRRFIQGRLLINGLHPIPPTKIRDTCLLARSLATFSSNRLKHLAKILHLRHQKLDNNWPTAWFKVMQGSMAHLNALARYCKGDVEAVEELYFKLRPFDQPHPRLYPSTKGDTRCAACGGKVAWRGVVYLGEQIYRRYQCTTCWRWGRERKALRSGYETEQRYPASPRARRLRSGAPQGSRRRPSARQAPGRLRSDPQ